MDEVIEVQRFSCSICLNEEVEETKQCITNCEHSFCLDCINRWFNQRNTSCPMCRGNITTYELNGEQHHIIRINSNRNNTNDNNLRINMIQLRNKIYYMNFMLFLSFIYFIYSLYQNSLLIMERDEYKILYKNCSDVLIEDKLYMNMIENKVELSTVPVYLNHQLYNCLFPLYYIQKCLLHQH